MFEKPFAKMTDDELREELDYYLNNEPHADMAEWQRDVEVEITNILKIRATERELVKQLGVARATKFAPADMDQTALGFIIGIAVFVMYIYMTAVVLS